MKYLSTVALLCFLSCKKDPHQQTGSSPPPLSQPPQVAIYQCNDGIDNDGDGNIDYPADAGCRSAIDTNETDLVITQPPQSSPHLSAITWKGKTFFVAGVNFPWQNYGTDFGTGAWGKFTDWDKIVTDLQTLKSQGVSVVRWWLFADGRYSPEFNADATVSGIDAELLLDIDRALKAAADAGIYITFSVVDNRMWQPAERINGIQLYGHPEIITSSTAQQSFFEKALKPVLEHIAKSLYKDRVFAYDIVSEPEEQIVGMWGNGAKLELTAVQAFVKKATEVIHEYGGDALVTMDCGDYRFISQWKDLGLDFYELHYYPWLDFSKEIGSGIPPYASLGLDKPCIISEFQTVTPSYDQNSTTPLSAKWYLDVIMARGYAGLLAWSYQAGDNVSDWSKFQPLFTAWASVHRDRIGPK